MERQSNFLFKKNSLKIQFQAALS
jgi:hypothetical protein